MKNVAIILSAGSGSRMQSDIPKQYMPIYDKPVINYSLEVFEASDIITDIILVIGAADEGIVREKVLISRNFSKLRGLVIGGEERYDSVLFGLRYIDENLKNTDIVFIHDGARALVSEEIIKRSYEDALRYGSSVAAVPSKDTIKISDDKGFVVNTPKRENMWVIQTPQTFEFELIKDAYEEFGYFKNNNPTEAKGITDDAMVAERFANIRVKLTMGSYENIKITTPDDLDVAKTIMKGRLERGGQ